MFVPQGRGAEAREAASKLLAFQLGWTGETSTVQTIKVANHLLSTKTEAL
jgi:hypothetical protein